MTTQQQSAAAEGLQLIQSGDINAAIARFTEALHINQTDAETWGYLGIAQCKLGDIANGIASLQYAAYAQPTNAQAQYNLGIALYQAHRFSEAAAAFQQCLQLDRGHANATAAFTNLQPFLQAQAAAPNPASEPRTTQQVYPASPGPALANGPTYANTDQGLAAYTNAPQAMAAAPNSSGSPYVPAPSGMQYTAQPIRQPVAIPSTARQRLGRGLGWGAVWGQWWTLLYCFWELVHSGSGLSGAAVAVFVVAAAMFFAFVGAITGLIIGAIDADASGGVTVGVVVGLLLCGLEIFLSHSSLMVINIFFWFFTGRYIGARVAIRVQRPTIA